MLEDSKKNDKRNAKEQRKPRQRHQQAKADKKSEKPEESKSAPKVTVPQKPPVYESPPPEFYKNLKRETDEILKITEEENAKYKKKEIQSNWSKYEVPIESYDEIDEQENLGADYEQVIEASLSSGGHFQFKHEKSWDMNTGPSQYDKYFEINMEDLNVALCTIPFIPMSFRSERNDIEDTLFTESDILTMKNRSTRFKQKYFNDKSYSTPETIAQDKILNSLRDGIKSNDNSAKDAAEIEIKPEIETEEPQLLEDKPVLNTDVKLELKDNPNTDNSNQMVFQNNINIQNVPYKANPSLKPQDDCTLDDVIAHDDFIFRNTEKATKSLTEKSQPPNVEISEIRLVTQTEAKDISPRDTTITIIPDTVVEEAVKSKGLPTVETKAVAEPPVVVPSVETKKNPVFESPEDLEKWLDDYLDG